MSVCLKNECIVEYDVPATMRDGVVLRANIYRPVGEGKWPVLLSRIPYGKNLPLATSLFDPSQAACKGYVIIIQHTRGRYASEGEWQPYRYDALDGGDTICWAASIPNRDGTVGMFGAPNTGLRQWTPDTQQTVK